MSDRTIRVELMPSYKGIIIDVFVDDKMISRPEIIISLRFALRYCEFVSVNGYAPSIEEEDVDFFLNIDKAKLQPINRQLDELYTLMKSVESESERVQLSRIKHILEFTYTIPVESIAEKEEK
jgi:hypothetical protein